MTQDSKLVLESSLQVFFYDLLLEFNKKSLTPLPNEIIYYSSLVMDQYGFSNRYFEAVDGKIREKILGIKLLESSQLPKDKQKVAVRDVGEMALLLCGYFSESFNKKIVDTKYYNEIGVIAYKRLNSFVPRAYDVPNFFEKMSNQFNHVTTLMTLVSKRHERDPLDSFILINERKAV
ncbi:MAG: hypothetical protein ACXVLQ_11035 [Bacteriovorax sp.]